MRKKKGKRGRKRRQKLTASAEEEATDGFGSAENGSGVPDLAVTAS